MIEPLIPAETLIPILRAEYGLHVLEVSFIPLGVDRNAAVYRVIAKDQPPYFAKIRLGAFNEISILLPRFLWDQGIRQVIPPVHTTDGQLWADFDANHLILYPFIEGRNAYEVNLSETQWTVLGDTLQRLHQLILLPNLYKLIRLETFAPTWRDKTKRYLDQASRIDFGDPLAKELAKFLGTKRSEITSLVDKAEALARELKVRDLEFVLCHADLHAGNLHISGAGKIYIVDWDDPCLAPKERDLMFIGGGLVGNWRAPEEEIALFYRGYGETRVDDTALSYYQYERIVVDIAEFCESIFQGEESQADREQAFKYLKSNFDPDGTIEIARQSDRTGS